MQTAIGPITDTVEANGNSGIATTGGVLNFSVNSDDATFQASTTSSPEPGSISLMLAGGLALWMAKGRYNARRAKDSRP